MRPESLSDYGAILSKRAFVVLLAAILVGGSVLAVGLRLPRVYSTTLLMDVEAKQQPSASLLPNLVQTALGGGADPVAMQTIATRLTARNLLERALREYADVEPTGAKLLPSIPYLAKSVRASVETGSRLIQLSVSLREPEGGARNAALFANQLVKTFRDLLAEEEVQDRLGDTGVQLELVARKRKELEERLDATRRDLLAFARGAGNPTLWSAELAQLYQRLETLSAERREAASRRREAEAKVEAATAALERESDFVLSARSEGEHPLRVTIAEQLLTYGTLAAQKSGESLGANDPEQRGILAAKEQLQKERHNVPERGITETYGANPRRERLVEQRFESEVALAHVADEIQMLDRLIKQVSENVQTSSSRIPESHVQLEILQRQTESLARVYDELLLRQSQVELALGETLARQNRRDRRVAGIAIIDAARPQFVPVRPRILFLIAAGTALGVLAGVAVGFFLEWQSFAGLATNDSAREQNS